MSFFEKYGYLLVCLKGFATEEYGGYPSVMLWDAVEYAVYCHIMWSAIGFIKNYKLLLQAVCIFVVVCAVLRRVQSLFLFYRENKRIDDKPCLLKHLTQCRKLFLF